jgi:DNA polymerase III delta subunit
MASASSMATVPFSLICGDEEFSVKQRAAALYQQWCAEQGGTDHEIIDANASNVSEALKAFARLREALYTLPFFGGAKTIWFRNCNFLGEERISTAANVTASLASLAEELKKFDWRNVRLIISSGKVDKRKLFFKTVEKIGTVELFAGLSLDDKDWTLKAERQVEAVFQSRQKRIRDDALGELITRVGPHLRLLMSEAEKLSLYVGERPEVTLEDVETVSVRNKQARAFALADALGERDLQRLLRRLDEELWGMQFDKDKSEIGLLYGLVTKMRALIFVKEMIREGWLKENCTYQTFKTQLERIPPGQFAEDKRFNPLAYNAYVLYKAMPQTRNYKPEELVRALELLLRCNLRMVSGSQDDKLLLQQTLISIVNPASSGSAARAS